MKKRWIAAALCCVLLACAGCGASKKEEEVKADETVTEEVKQEEAYTPATHESGKYYIGIVQQADHGALNEVASGFQEALSQKLGVQVEFDYQVADGTQEGVQKAVNKFITDQDNLILAEGTLALTEAADATTEIPIVGAAVTDFLVAGAVSSTGEPGRNVTGISDLPPMVTQKDALKGMLGTGDKVGIIYCEKETNSIYEVGLMTQYLSDDNIEYNVYTFSDVSLLKEVVEQAMDETNVIYLPTDNAIAANMSIVKQASLDKKVPVFTSDENMCKEGGVLTYSIDYKVLGERTAAMAYDILMYVDRQNANTGSTDETADDDTGYINKMSIDRVRDTAALKYNPEMAEALNWTPPYNATALEVESSTANTTNTADANSAETEGETATE